MKIGDSESFEADCDSGQLRINAWAKDEAGNAAFISFDSFPSEGHASFNLEQAKNLAARLSDLVRAMEEAEASQ